MLYLKQSTASQSVLIGPFVDSTDGATAETGLTIANTDIRLSKNGGNLAAKNSGGGTHDEAGWYTITLDATDTDTVGRLQIHCKMSGALMVHHEYQVLEETIYDALIGASAAGELAVKLSTQGKADVNAEADTALTDYDPPTKAELDTAVANVSVDEIQATALADLFNTDSGTTYASAVAGSPVKEIADNAGGSSLTVGDIADAVWDEDATGHQTTGTFGAAIGDPGANTETIYDAVVTDAAGTNVAADIVAVKAETASILDDTDLIDDGTSGLAKIATDVAAILVDTAEIGTAGAGLTNINLPNQTMDITGNITGNLSGSVGSVTGAVGSVTGNVGGNVTGSVGSLAAQAKTDVNAEVVDALATDTYAEPGQGAPAATASLKDKIGYLYKAWRNKSDQDATTYQLYADDASTVDQKATVSDDGTTATKGEVATGP